MTPGSVVVGFLDAGQWSACFGLSFTNLCLHDLTGRQRIIRDGVPFLRALTGTGGIPDNRNQVARDFLDSTDGEWLFMVDTDMGFTADTVDRMVASADPVQRPVLGALTFQIKRVQGKQTELRAERFRIQPVTLEMVEYTGDDAEHYGETGFRPIDYPRNQVIQVDGTGAACLLIHRDALAKVRAEHGDAWFDPMKHPTAGGGGKPRRFSEDLSFCLRLQSVGIQVHVDTSIHTTHDKGGIFLDEETYDLQRSCG